jgi:hypothetical protein
MIEGIADVAVSGAGALRLIRKYLQVSWIGDRKRAQEERVDQAKRAVQEPIPKASERMAAADVV